MNKTINWLEGFLHGPGIILIHHPKLLEAIDSWIDSLNSGTLQNYLPVLRRIFSKFSKPEKEKIIMLSSKKNGQKINKIDNVEFDKERLLIIQPVLNKILKE
jgi:ATPase subunit of ABC transporter with duplicated ATPase domains